MTRLNPFVVLERRSMFGGYRVLGDTPTPALIDASNESGAHDAYQHPETGFWRLRDDRYDPPGTVYTPVYVAHLPECPGPNDWGMGHLMEWEQPTYGPRKQCEDHARDDGHLPPLEDEA